MEVNLRGKRKKKEIKLHSIERIYQAPRQDSVLRGGALGEMQACGPPATPAGLRASLPSRQLRLPPQGTTDTAAGTTGTDALAARRTEVRGGGASTAVLPLKPRVWLLQAGPPVADSRSPGIVPCAVRLWVRTALCVGTPLMLQQGAPQYPTCSDLMPTESHTLRDWA